MMNKQEIQNEIKKTKEHLANMEKMLVECEYERWKPKNSEDYYFVNSYGVVELDTWTDTSAIDGVRYNTYNCFQTQEEAEADAEKIFVRRMLEDIARRLNKGRKIDWNNSIQNKYFIGVQEGRNTITWDYEMDYRHQGTVYCINKSFKDIAIQEIGEERLKKYLRGE